MSIFKYTLLFICKKAGESGPEAKGEKDNRKNILNQPYLQPRASVKVDQIVSEYTGT